MSLHSVHNEPYQVYFCTITCYKWLPLFEKSKSYEAVYSWFRHLKNDGCSVAGYVIMPNHFHVLLHLSHKGTSINQLVGEGKRFMAYAVIKGLKERKEMQLLKVLEEGVSAKEKLKGKIHQVFRLSFDARMCYSEQMVEQKLDYIHHNPVSGKWNLIDDFALYPHSSVAYYELGKESESIVHYKSLEGEGFPKRESF
jgi:REP element-mobilizing transposase RayT